MPPREPSDSRDAKPWTSRQMKSFIIGGSIGVAAGMCLLPAVVWVMFSIDWLGGQMRWWRITTDSEDDSVIPLVVIALGAYGAFVLFLGALAVRGFSDFLDVNAASAKRAAFAMALIVPTAYAIHLLLAD